MEAKIAELRTELAMGQAALQQYFESHGVSAEFDTFQLEVTKLAEKLRKLEQQQGQQHISGAPAPGHTQGNGGRPTPTLSPAVSRADPASLGAAAGAEVTLTVECPAGSGAGQELRITTGWGEELAVTVPDGVSAGQSFLVAAPPQQERPAASPAPSVQHKPRRRRPQRRHQPPPRNTAPRSAAAIDAAEHGIPPTPAATPSSFYLSAAGKQSAGEKKIARERELAAREREKALQLEVTQLRQAHEAAMVKSGAELEAERLRHAALVAAQTAALADSERRLEMERQLSVERVRAAESAGRQRLHDATDASKRALAEAEAAAGRRLAEAEEAAGRRLAEVEEATARRLEQAEALAQQRVEEAEQAAQRRVQEVETEAEAKLAVAAATAAETAAAAAEAEATRLERERASLEGAQAAAEEEKASSQRAREQLAERVQSLETSKAAVEKELRAQLVASEQRATLAVEAAEAAERAAAAAQRAAAEEAHAAELARADLQTLQKQSAKLRTAKSAAEWAVQKQRAGTGSAAATRQTPRHSTVGSKQQKQQRPNPQQSRKQQQRPNQSRTATAEASQRRGGANARPTSSSSRSATNSSYGAETGGEEHHPQPDGAYDHDDEVYDSEGTVSSTSEHAPYDDTGAAATLDPAPEQARQGATGSGALALSPAPAALEGFDDDEQSIVAADSAASMSVFEVAGPLDAPAAPAHSEDASRLGQPPPSSRSTTSGGGGAKGSSASGSPSLFRRGGGGGGSTTTASAGRSRSKPPNASAAATTASAAASVSPTPLLGNPFGTSAVGSTPCLPQMDTAAIMAGVGGEGGSDEAEWAEELTEAHPVSHHQQQRRQTQTAAERAPEEAQQPAPPAQQHQHRAGTAGFRQQQKQREESQRLRRQQHAQRSRNARPSQPPASARAPSAGGGRGQDVEVQRAASPLPPVRLREATVLRERPNRGARPVCQLEAATLVVPRERKLGRNGETWLRCAWLAPDQPAGPDATSDDPHNPPPIEGWLALPHNLLSGGGSNARPAFGVGPGLRKESRANTGKSTCAKTGGRAPQIHSGGGNSKKKLVVKKASDRWRDCSLLVTSPFFVGVRTCVVRADSAEGVYHAVLASLEAQGVRLSDPGVPPLQLMLAVNNSTAGPLQIRHVAAGSKPPTQLVPLLDLAQQLPLPAGGVADGRKATPPQYRLRLEPIEPLDVSDYLENDADNTDGDHNGRDGNSFPGYDDQDDDATEHSINSGWGESSPPHAAAHVRAVPNWARATGGEDTDAGPPLDGSFHEDVGGGAEGYGYGDDGGYDDQSRYITAHEADAAEEEGALGVLGQQTATLTGAETLEQRLRSLSSALHAS